VPKPMTGRTPFARAALIMAATALVTAGCSGATPQAASTSPAPGAPSDFAGTLVPTHGETAWPVGVFSSATGQLVRQLTGPPAGSSDLVVGVRQGWVYYAVWSRAGVLSGVWRVPLTGGPARLVQAGASSYALSSDGRMAASVVTADHGRTTEIVVANLVTGHRDTIFMATNRPGFGVIDVTNLAWAPDDTHLAVEVVLAAFASEVLVFDTRTARSIGDGRAVPCPGGCAAHFPSYLSNGTLTYVTEQIPPSGTSTITLVSWAGGHLTKLATMWAGPQPLPLVQGESTTPQGAAIWVLQAQLGTAGHLRWQSTIWRKSGGQPARIRTLPPVTQSPAGRQLTDIAW
jgi:hypothetical protein